MEKRAEEGRERSTMGMRGFSGGGGMWDLDFTESECSCDRPSDEWTIVFDGL